MADIITRSAATQDLPAIGALHARAMGPGYIPTIVAWIVVISSVQTSKICL